jgi:hypothetical protein
MRCHDPVERRAGLSCQDDWTDPAPQDCPILFPIQEG